MDQRKCEEDMLDFQTGTTLAGVEKSTVLSMPPLQKSGNWNSELEVATQTPEKMTESLHNKSKEREIELPEKYMMMLDLFNGMTCSLRLLSLCKRPTTFQNICSQVKVLKKGKFSYTDLARMKYVLPEAIQIERISVHDQKTLHMRPELKVSLLLDVIEGHQEQSDFIALHQVFSVKLLTIATKYPEDFDIPMAILPDPFSQSCKTTSDNKLVNGLVATLAEPFSKLSQGCSQAPLLNDSLNISHPASLEPELLSEPSFQHPSFGRCFSKRVVVDEDEKCALSVSSANCMLNQSCGSLNKQDIAVEVLKEFRGMDNERDIYTESDIQNKQLKESVDAYSQQNISHSPPQMNSSIAAFQSPMQELASSSDILMTETPAQMPPRRSVPSCDEKLKAVTRLTPSNMSAKRSLVFSYGEGEISKSTELHSCRLRNDGTSRTPMTKGFTLEDAASHHEVVQKVNMSIGTTAEECKSTSCLSDLVPLIHQIFLSVNCAAITREELVHKIIVNSIDTVERREVEEYIELLEKMVPDWLCKRLAPSGGILYNIKKAVELSSIQARFKIDT